MTKGFFLGSPAMPTRWRGNPQVCTEHTWPKRFRDSADPIWFKPQNSLGYITPGFLIGISRWIYRETLWTDMNSNTHLNSCIQDYWIPLWSCATWEKCGQCPKHQTGYPQALERRKHYSKYPTRKGREWKPQEWWATKAWTWECLEHVEQRNIK